MKNTKKQSISLHNGHIAKSCVCCGSPNLSSSPAVMMPFVSHRALGLAPLKIDASWGLKTIQSGMAYVLCNSLLCENCQLLFLDIRFTDEEMLRLYENYRGAEYTSLRDFYEPGYMSRNAELGRRLPYILESEAFISCFVKTPETILDWGGDTGINTPFKNVASLVQIYDISGKPDSQRGLNSNREQLLGVTFDLITCCHVLEHVPYPAKVLVEIRKHMNVKTCLFLEVPLEVLLVEHDVKQILTLKKHWHEHINFFSKDSLINLLTLTGFNILGLRKLETLIEGRKGFVFQVVCSL